MSPLSPGAVKKAAAESHADCPLCQDVSQQPFVLYEDENWMVRHSAETNILGYVVLQARRHILDLSLADDAETAAYGVLLRRVMQAVHEVIDCQRVYTFSLGEAVPHYHLHVIPRAASLPKAYRARGIMQYPLQPVADKALVEEVCNRLKRILKRS